VNCFPAEGFIFSPSASKKPH